MWENSGCNPFGDGFETDSVDSETVDDYNNEKSVGGGQKRDVISIDEDIVGVARAQHILQVVPPRIRYQLLDNVCIDLGRLYALNAKVTIISILPLLSSVLVAVSIAAEKVHLSAARELMRVIVSNRRPSSLGNLSGDELIGALIVMAATVLNHKKLEKMMSDASLVQCAWTEVVLAGIPSAPRDVVAATVTPLVMTKKPMTQPVSTRILAVKLCCAAIVRIGEWERPPDLIKALHGLSQDISADVRKATVEALAHTIAPQCAPAAFHHVQSPATSGEGSATGTAAPLTPSSLLRRGPMLRGLSVAEVDRIVVPLLDTLVHDEDDTVRRAAIVAAVEVAWAVHTSGTLDPDPLRQLRESPGKGGADSSLAVTVGDNPVNTTYGAHANAVCKHLLVPIDVMLRRLWDPKGDALDKNPSGGDGANLECVGCENADDVARLLADVLDTATTFDITLAAEIIGRATFMMQQLDLLVNRRGTELLVSLYLNLFATDTDDVRVMLARNLPAMVVALHCGSGVSKAENGTAGAESTSSSPTFASLSSRTNSPASPLSTSPSSLSPVTTRRSCIGRPSSNDSAASTTSPAPHVGPTPSGATARTGVLEPHWGRRRASVGTPVRSHSVGVTAARRRSETDGRRGSAGPARTTSGAQELNGSGDSVMLTVLSANDAQAERGRDVLVEAIVCRCKDAVRHDGVEVRRVLAHALLPVVTTVQTHEHARAWCSMTIELLKDDDVAVIEPVCDALPTILACLHSNYSSQLPSRPHTGKRCYRRASASAFPASELISALIKCDQTLKTARRWRTRVTLMRLFASMYVYCLPRVLFIKLVPYVTEIVLETGMPRALQRAGLQTLAWLLRQTKRADQRNHVITWSLEELAAAESSYTRSLFFDFCENVMAIFSRAFVKDFFFEKVVELGKAPVVDMRMRLCQMAGSLKRLLTLPRDRPLLNMLNAVVDHMDDGFGGMHRKDLATYVDKAKEALENIDEKMIWQGSESRDAALDLADKNKADSELSDFGETKKGSSARFDATKNSLYSPRPPRARLAGDDGAPRGRMRRRSSGGGAVVHVPKSISEDVITPSKKPPSKSTTTGSAIARVKRDTVGPHGAAGGTRASSVAGGVDLPLLASNRRMGDATKTRSGTTPTAAPSNRTARTGHRPIAASNTAKSPSPKKPSGQSCIVPSTTGKTKPSKPASAKPRSAATSVKKLSSSSNVSGKNSNVASVSPQMSSAGPDMRGRWVSPECADSRAQTLATSPPSSTSTTGKLDTCSSSPPASSGAFGQSIPLPPITPTQATPLSTDGVAHLRGIDPGGLRLRRQLSSPGPLPTRSGGSTTATSSPGSRSPRSTTTTSASRKGRALRTVTSPAKPPSRSGGPARTAGINRRSSMM